MPKKSKVNKLAKMSDEERARYLQHRADIEEEARRRKIELVSRFIKNKLDREEAYHRINTAKLNQAWRHVLRRVKCQQMMQDIQGYRASFDFLVGRKDRLIAALTSAIEEADEQHRRSYHNHTENISYFLCICTEGLDKLQNRYAQQKLFILEGWEHDGASIAQGQEQAEFKLKLIRFIMQRDIQGYRKMKDTERATEVNDARLEHEEEMTQLRLPKESEIEHLRASIREVYNTFMKQHKPMFDHYEFLREKDDFYQRDIARNDQLIRKANKTVEKLQKELTKMTSTNENKLLRLEEQKQELSKRFWHLKGLSKVAETQDSEALLMLVNCSQDSAEWLESAKRKMERMTHLSALCAKYEVSTTTDEGGLMIFDNEDCKSDSTAFEHLNEDMIKECKQNKKLDKFMLKINQTNVQNVCLKSERAKLVRENAQIKNCLKRYLTELALGNEHERPVTVRLQANSGKLGCSSRPRRPVTCIEGAVSNAVMHEKRMKVLQQKTKDLAIRAYPRVQNWM